MRGERRAELELSSFEVRTDERYGFLTQGDNSPVDDGWLYPLGQHYLFRSDSIGTVKGHLPYIGQLALLSVDFPWLKQFVMGISTLLFVRSFVRSLR